MSHILVHVVYLALTDVYFRFRIWRDNGFYLLFGINLNTFLSQIVNNFVQAYVWV